jgi:large exoprotein involved in heme utilization and adhesion
LTITTRSLIVRDEAQVDVRSLSSGKAGNLEITAHSIQLDNRGKLTAETMSGDGGNIILQDLDLLLMRRNSQISTTAGTAQAGGNGGNIEIDTDFIVAVPQENSDIIANAFTGRGGNINITAQGIYGIESRPKVTPLSDITASSQFGINGVVTINTPDVDPNRGLVNFPVEPVSVEVAQGCQVSGKQSSVAFFNTGRGGLAPNPYEPLSSSDIWENVPPPTHRSENAAGATNASASPATPPDKIVEAQGWLVNEKGEVVLVAEMPTTHSQGRCRLH